MEDKLNIITQNSFINFLNRLSKNYNVIVPFGDDDYFLEPFKGKFTFNKYRAISSLRQFLIPSQDLIATYFEERSIKRKPFCIVGAKNCDLQSLKIQDYVFLSSEVDPNYKLMRDANVIISSDCTSFKDVCFCLSLDINPYPEELFDLNISLIDNVFLVESGSSKGEKLIEENRDLFQDVKKNYLEERSDLRKNIIDRLFGHLKSQNLPPRGVLYELIKDGYQDSIWDQEALRCVECGACIMNCPTCHCFLIFDTEKNGQFLKARVWDGCQFKNFARVAGGTNPLIFRIQRLRNRYIKKFEFFPINCGLYACTGCGRCIENCIAKIDLREIFKGLAKSQRQEA